MADTKISALTQQSTPALTDELVVVDSTGPTNYMQTLKRFSGFLLNHVAQGHLTTETGVPVSSSDRTGQSTIYYTPFRGNKVALYDGTRWNLYKFTELSLALSGLTAGKLYDVWLYDNASTLTLELSAAWTNNSTRADALTTQDGIAVKSSATTRRHVGTIAASAATTTEDSALHRWVWSRDNQVARRCSFFDGTSHSINTPFTSQYWNSNSNSYCDFVVGDSQVVPITVYGRFDFLNAIILVGVDDATLLAQTTPDYGLILGSFDSANTYAGGYQPRAFAAGYHVLNLLEQSNGVARNAYTGAIDAFLLS